jgi:MarR family transcriptional regulator, temperature-dependent positive regulator of motility
MAGPTKPTDDLDYSLLKHIDEQGAANQRDLALRLGVSLGKVNYCLRAVIERGWVKANNFRRSDNKWAYSYILTPHGMTAKIRLARHFLERKEQEFESLQSQIELLRREISQEQHQHE